MEEIKTTFGERLADLRSELSLSQQGLADKLEMSKSAINNYESGTNYPEVRTLIKLCEIFNVSADYLLCRTNARHNWDDMNEKMSEAYTANEIVAQIRKLSAEHVETLVQYAEFLETKQ